MLAAIASGYFFGLLAPLIARVLRSASGAVMAVIPALLFAYFLQFVGQAAEGAPWRFVFAWGGPGGLEAAFRLDSLALIFVLLISALGVVAMIAVSSLALGNAARGRLLFAVLFLLSSSLGFVLADTPVLVMSFSIMATLSAFLVATARRGGAARVSGVPLLVALIGGDLMLLAGLAGLFIGSPATGIAELVSHPPGVDMVTKTAAVLLVIAGLTRLNIVSADLRTPASRRMSEPAALFVQGGGYVPLMLYIVLRFAPALSAIAEYRFALGLSGAALLCVGIVIGLNVRRLRPLIASVSLIMIALAFLHLASFGTRGVASAILITITHGLGLGALLLGCRLVSGEDSWVELGALRSRVLNRPLALGIVAVAAIAWAGLIPSLSLLTLSNSLATGLSPMLNIAEIGFSIVGHTTIVALLLIVVRSLVRGAQGPSPTIDRGNPVATYASAILLLAALIVLGWWPSVLGSLFVGPISALMGPSQAIAPFWPQGLAIAFAAGVLVIALAIVWFEAAVRRAVRWVVVAIPGWPMRSWRAGWWLVALLASTGSRALALFGLARAGFVCISVACALLVWLGVGSLFGAPPALHVVVLPIGLVGALAALGAIVTLIQRSCEHAVPVLALTGLLTVITMLLAGIVDLAFMAVLILVLEAAFLFVIAPRISAWEASSPVLHLGVAVRIGLALVAGAGATLVALAAPKAGLRSMSWTRVDQLELWCAIAVLLLMLGVVITDLNRQKLGGVS